MRSSDSSRSRVGVFVRTKQGPSRTHWGLMQWPAHWAREAISFAADVRARSCVITLIVGGVISSRGENFLCVALLVFCVSFSPVALVVLRGDPNDIAPDPPTPIQLACFFLELPSPGRPRPTSFGTRAHWILDRGPCWPAEPVATGSQRTAPGVYGLAFFWLVAPLVIRGWENSFVAAFVQRYFTFCLPARRSIGRRLNASRLRRVPRAGPVGTNLFVLGI